MKGSDHVRKGNIAEVRFVHDALVSGFNPSIPWGNQPGYDVVLSSGTRNFRVQVKSTSFVGSSGLTTVTVASRGPTRLNRTYDVLAIWFVREGKWLFLPRSKVPRKNQIFFRVGQQPPPRAHGPKRSGKLIPDSRLNNWAMFLK